MGPEPRFDVERFSRLVHDGVHPDEAARQVGINPDGVYTLLKRRGLRLRCVTTREYRVEAIVPEEEGVAAS